MSKGIPLYGDLDLVFYEGGLLYWAKSATTGTRIAGNPLSQTPNRDGYLRVKLGRKTVFQHNVVWQLHYGAIPAGYVIDHVNQVVTDNRIENLRLATLSQNACNMKTNTRNTTGVKGVSYIQSRAGSKKWKSQVKYNGKAYVKWCATLEDARQHQDEMRISLHKEFANNG